MRKNSVLTCMYDGHTFLMSFGFAVLYLNAHGKMWMKHIHKKYQHYFHGD